MVSILMLLAFVQGQPPQPVDRPPVAHESPPSTQPAVDLSTGPLRVELNALMEGRYRFIDPTGGARPSEMQLQFRVVGDRMLQVAKYGKVILTELVDDTGKSLIGPDAYTPEDRTNLRLSTFPPARLREGGIQLIQRADASARAAKTIRTMRGSIRLVLAESYDEVTVMNPLGSAGTVIDDQRLKELGVEIRIVPTDDLTRPTPPGKAVAVQFVKKPENVRNIALHDAWMKPLRTRDSVVPLKDGSNATVYTLIGGEVNADTQMVIQVFPNVEDIELPVDLKDIELP